MACAMNPRSLLPVFAALTLSGCAASGDFPSLARRDVERDTASAEAAPAPAPPAITPPGATTTAQVAALVDRARAAHGRFAGVRGRAESLVAAARGAAPGSDAWSIASVAIGELDAARGATALPLSELDTLYTAERAAHFQSETGDALAIEAARQTVAALLAEEDRALAGLSSRLAR